jgi:predicted AlkP superfamily pyrophosphatase or phosphodiesterase
MLPAVPKTLGRLSDVFASCLGAITGVDNRLGLRRADRVVAVLVDGLGSYNIKSGGGRIIDSHPLHAGFPSTTATSITSFGTGLNAGEHGIVGYRVLDPKTQQPLNQLTGWSQSFDPLEWQPQQTIAERAVASGVEAFVIGPAEYAQSGFTALTMRGAKYLPAKTMLDRVELALQVLASPQSSLTYLYVPELDQKAHAFGVDSMQWLETLEELESAITKLTEPLTQRKFENAGVVLTADHGIVDVPQANQIYLDELDLPTLKLVGGDPRANYLYLEAKVDETEAVALADAIERQLHALPLGGGVRVVTRQQLIDAKWFGSTVTADAQSRMPELFALAVSRTALYHRDFAAKKSLNMIGQHGSISPEELAIPLIKYGAFAR